MKRIPLSFAFAMFVCLCAAQDNGKVVIALEPITTPQDGKDYSLYQQQISSLFSNTLVNSKRCTVTPTDNWNVQQNQTGDPYADAARSYGVTFLFNDAITLLASYESVGKDLYGNPTYSYSARITVLVKVLTVETGMFFTTKTFDVKSQFFPMSSTPEGAINNAIKRLGNEINQWVSETFPLTIPVLRVDESTDKRNGVQILVQAGSDAGLVEAKKRKDRTQFKIIQYVNEPVNGQQMTRTVQVGTAEVERVHDRNFSNCLVTSGDADVVRKLNEHTPLFLITVN